MVAGWPARIAGATSGRVGGGPARLVAELAEVVGPAQVVTDPDVLAGYLTDWTGRYTGTSPAVVRPGSAAEVAGVLAVCRAHGVPVVPQGGNSGLVAGGVPLTPAVLLSTRRLTGLEDAGPGATQVTAGAGLTVGALGAALRPHGLRYGVDLASRDVATVGGTVSTNAGGLRVLRLGDTRAQLLGVEAVLADGSVISRLAGLERDNTGYHLAGLLCGAEGTLGVITRVRLRVRPAPARAALLLAGFARLPEAVAAAAALRQVTAVEAVELVPAAGLRLLQEGLGLRPPLPAATGVGAVVLAEATAAAGADPVEALTGAMDALPAVLDAVLAADARGVRELWAYRERMPEAVATAGRAQKFDVTVPVPRLAEFYEQVPRVVAARAPQARCWLFGHAADGNAHVNVTGVDPADVELSAAVAHDVYATAVGFGGCIATEHGIGRAKRDFLALDRSAAELAAFAALKRALDPTGLLNPGVILPAR